MNGKKSKFLRRIARVEMAADRAPERDLVASPYARTTAFNSPNSVRGMYLQLKKQHDKAGGIVVTKADRKGVHQ